MTEDRPKRKGLLDEMEELERRRKEQKEKKRKEKEGRDEDLGLDLGQIR